MGSDDAPTAELAATRAATDAGLAVTLFGLADLAASATDAGASFVEANQVIEMADDPAKAVRTKRDSTLVLAVEAVRDKQAAAMVSAGNTGAVAAAALLRLRRLRGVARPAIATPLPLPKRSPVLLLDSGAMADCQPSWLHQFARMGSTLCRVRYGTPEPAVGLMSIGEEPEKGNALTKATHKLLAADDRLNFVGNIEGRDVLGGATDVVVTDGFTGNVLLKALEGAASFFTKLVAGRLAADEKVGPGALEVLAPLADDLNPDHVGGAMLLGVRGVCIISHGSSSAHALTSAITAGHTLAAADLLDELAESVEDVPARAEGEPPT